jgi:sulfatase maturation enzyme AslB (radical SAM superfamily)
MSPATLRRALAWALRSGAPPPEISFSGGEPLLAFELIQGAIAEIERATPSERRPRATLLTNGVRLDRRIIAFCAAHQVEIQLSCDGIAAAQEHRARGTAARLRRRLAALRRAAPDVFERQLTVVITLTPTGLRWLARSVEALLEQGVANIAITPALGVPPGPGFDPATIHDAFDAVARQASAVRNRAGENPVTFLRPAHGSPAPAGASRTMCGAAGGEMAAVTPEGNVYPCALLIPELHAGLSATAQAVLSALRIGRIDDPELEARRRRFAERARTHPLFARKETRLAGRSRCAACEALGDCGLCPVALLLRPEPLDLQRVPSFACEVSRVIAAVRRRQQRDRTARAAATVLPPGSRRRARAPRRETAAMRRVREFAALASAARGAPRRSASGATPAEAAD